MSLNLPFPIKVEFREDLDTREFKAHVNELKSELRYKSYIYDGAIFISQKLKLYGLSDSTSDEFKSKHIFLRAIINDSINHLKKHAKRYKNNNGVDLYQIFIVTDRRASYLLKPTTSPNVLREYLDKNK